MYYIGLMSGTSADAIDAALVDIDAREKVTMIATHRHRYPPSLAARVEALVTGRTTGLADIAHLDVEIGTEFAAAARTLMQAQRLGPRSVAAIGSHGQTVGHFPDPPFPVTLQLGCPATIAAHVGVQTVADFRMSDMAAGGQGAPLAPAFHRAAFGSASEPRAIVNIGGIANLTVLPREPGAKVIGFDTGPGNTLLDAWVRRERGIPYDAHGAWAASGAVDTDLLTRLLRDPYFKTPPPKSTGREHFNLAWITAACAARRDLRGADVQATLTRLTARTIADALAAATPEATVIYLCGGGVHNDTLVRELRDQLPGRAVADTEALGIHPDWVESAAFAWLAHRRLQRKPGNIPSVTGARREVVLGAVWEAKAEA